MLGCRREVRQVGGRVDVGVGATHRHPDDLGGVRREQRTEAAVTRQSRDERPAGRQQQILAAVAHKMAGPAMFAKLPGLMSQAASLVQTNFPAAKVADTVKFVQSVPSTNWDNYVLGPPYSVSTATAGASTSCLQLDKVATLSVKLFGSDSRYSGKKQGPTC